MLKEFTAKGNFAVLMYMGDTDKLEVSQTLNSDMSCFLLYGSIQPLAFFFAENIHRSKLKKMLFFCKIIVAF